LGKTSSLPEEDVEEPASHTAAGPGAAARTIWCFDLRAHRPAQLYLEEIARITGVAAPTVPAELAAATAPAQEIAEATRPRWYPVLDFARCTNCLECLNFCLFGVFGLDAEGKITAEQPDACRAGCPACSRICPAAAIMFPQHKDPGIAGDPKASLSGLKLDLSQLFSGGLAELAAAERQRALLRKQQDEAAADRTEPARPPAADELDRLVDEVDDLDL